MAEMTPEERQGYAREAWRAFQGRRAGRNHMSPAEWHVVAGWMDREVPLRVVLRGIEDCGGPPKTLLGIVGAVEEAYRHWQRSLSL